MDLATATLLVNGIIALMNALPSIINSIQNLDAPEEDKQALIDRIKAAKADFPIWL